MKYFVTSPSYEQEMNRKIIFKKSHVNVTFNQLRNTFYCQELNVFETSLYKIMDLSRNKNNVKNRNVKNLFDKFI